MKARPAPENVTSSDRSSPGTLSSDGASRASSERDQPSMARLSSSMLWSMSKD
jgi:hypothetical protein